MLRKLRKLRQALITDSQLAWQGVVNEVGDTGPLLVELLSHGAPEQASGVGVGVVRELSHLTEVPTGSSSRLLEALGFFRTRA